MYQSFDRRSKTRDTSKYSDNDDDSDDPEGLLIMRVRKYDVSPNMHSNCAIYFYLFSA